MSKCFRVVKGCIDGHINRMDLKCHMVTTHKWGRIMWTKQLTLKKCYRKTHGDDAISFQLAA